MISCKPTFQQKLIFMFINSSTQNSKLPHATTTTEPKLKYKINYKMFSYFTKLIYILTSTLMSLLTSARGGWEYEDYLRSLRYIALMHVDWQSCWDAPRHKHQHHHQTEAFPTVPPGVARGSGGSRRICGAFCVNNKPKWLHHSLPHSMVNSYRQVFIQSSLTEFLLIGRALKTLKTETGSSLDGFPLGGSRKWNALIRTHTHTHVHITQVKVVLPGRSETKL